MEKYLNFHERFVNSCIKHKELNPNEIELNMVNTTTPYRNSKEIKHASKYAIDDSNHKVKLPRNSICLCGSGLKHKKCCGKFEG